eukprot:12269186-Alexandrium_andersonii.AAC.1
MRWCSTWRFASWTLRPALDFQLRLFASLDTTQASRRHDALSHAGAAQRKAGMEKRTAEPPEQHSSTTAGLKSTCWTDQRDAKTSKPNNL